MKLMKVLLLGAMILAACGESPKPAARAPEPAKSALPPAASAKPPAPRENALVVAIANADVEETLHVTPEEARAWAADAENAKRVHPAVRHVLVKSDKADAKAHAAAKKKAEAILAKLQRGGDWDKVARESSEDPGSKEKGGRYSGDMVPMFVTEFRDAYDALTPGETRKTVVETQFGWHVIKKDPPDDEARMAALRTARAPAEARRVAELLAPRLANVETHDDAERAIRAALAGPPASDVPVTLVVAAPASPGAAEPHSACAVLQGAPDGKVTSAEVGAPFAGWLVVKRGVAEPARADVCKKRDAQQQLSPEQVQELLEQRKKQQQP